MKRSCYALTWLMGTLAGCLVAVNVVSGQHPPAGAPDDAPDDTATSQRTLDDGPTRVTAGTAAPAVTAVTAGPLGWLPYDDEYHCEVASENPDALPSLSIWDGVRVVEAAPIGPFEPVEPVESVESVARTATGESGEASRSAVTIVTSAGGGSADDGAVESSVESSQESVAQDTGRGEGELPFRVLGYGASEEVASVESNVEAEIVLKSRVASSGSPVAVAWMRGFARTLQAAGDWFDGAAGALEGRTDLAVGD